MYTKEDCVSLREMCRESRDILIKDHQTVSEYFSYFSSIYSSNQRAYKDLIDFDLDTGKDSFEDRYFKTLKAQETMLRLLSENIDNVPLYINDEDNFVKIVANWRLKIGK
jgi:hypothetical protein